MRVCLHAVHGPSQCANWKQAAEWPNPVKPAGHDMQRAATIIYRALQIEGVSNRKRNRLQQLEQKHNSRSQK